MRLGIWFATLVSTIALTCLHLEPAASPPPRALIGLAPDAALAVFGVPERIVAAQGWAEWSWGEEGVRGSLLFVEDRVVLATPPARAAFGRGKRPALGRGVPVTGIYTGQSLTSLVERIGPVQSYVAGGVGLELSFEAGARAWVVDGRVMHASGQ